MPTSLDIQLYYNIRAYISHGQVHSACIMHIHSCLCYSYSLTFLWLCDEYNFRELKWETGFEEYLEYVKRKGSTFWIVFQSFVWLPMVI